MRRVENTIRRIEVLYEKYKLYLADNKGKIDEYIKDWR